MSAGFGRLTMEEPAPCHSFKSKQGGTQSRPPKPMADDSVSELKEQAQSLASIRRARSTSTPRARANARRKVKPAQASPGSPGASSRQAQSLSWCVDEPPMSPAQSPELGVSTLQALPGRDDGDFQWANAERRRLETECRVHQLSSEELRQEVQKLNESCQLLQRELELEVKKRTACRRSSWS